MLRSTAMLALVCPALISFAAQASDAVTRIEADAPVRVTGTAAPADSYVEARFRPLAPGRDGKLYVVGRYQDEKNWYGAGVAFQGTTGRVQVEVVRMQDGQLTRLKQFGRAGASDGRFNTVRLEMAGANLAAYLNGERVTIAVDGALPLPGRYGVFAQGAAFEVGTPVAGDAADKPARLALARAPQRVQLSVGDAAVSLPVSALGSYRLPDAAAAPVRLATRSFITQGAIQDAAAAATGAQPFRFTAVAADPALLRVQVADGAVSLAPVAAGTTTVMLTSVDDPNVLSVIDVQVAAASAPAPASYKLAGAVTPAIGERDVPADTPLRLHFDAAPTLGMSGGAIRVYRKRDGALVDTVRAGGESDQLGYEGQPFRRALRLQPIAIEAREAIVHLHSAKLRPGEEYIVTVDDGVFSGTLGGQPFAGIAKGQGWAFRTKATLPRGARFVVDDDGKADFRTVQGALNHVMQHTARTAPVTVEIRNGRYQEQLYLRGKDNVTLRGQSRDGVVIDAQNGDGLNPGSGTAQEARSPGITGGRALFLIEDADLVTLDTLTIRNSVLRSAPNGGQAETVFFNSEGRLVAKNASFFSEQDTIQVRGYAWFYRTLVAGNVDFIWGNNHAALFEESEIRTVGDSANSQGGGYVLQARTVGANDRGFLFLNSRLTHGPGPTGNDVPAGATWLARSAGYATAWDHIAFIDCRMGPHIAPGGWAGNGVAKQPAPNPLAASATAGWREAGSMDLDGRPLDLSRRANGRVLTPDEAKAAYTTRAAFFAGFPGGWNPRP
ncbi:pectin methylesterase-like acyl-CoA thioesterase [Pseudoduganella lurida]|uniref:Pectin methylesterase-like acyl-CoA thioesterase n=1 Tax=Pseudoduganella lurida TaxID=1036180 RepID=A0A562R0Q8_9BURK|nr:pectinesterase family protein [Pseudoduganella lurida]TWI62649.1 pectin methylesterase-like acyl-CoA thioesterase [Pseudoduganella lurida]